MTKTLRYLLQLERIHSLVRNVCATHDTDFVPAYRRQVVGLFP
jgi:hypothetical protein